MPKIHEMIEGKFLRKEDVGKGLLLSVKAVEQRNVAQQGAGEEMKWCLFFNEADKPMVLNSTNIQLCVAIFGSEDTDEWKNKAIVLYNDPNVSYAGKLVGGIRVRKPKPGTPLPAAAVVEPEPLTDDDIPF